MHVDVSPQKERGGQGIVIGIIDLKQEIFIGFT